MGKSDEKKQWDTSGLLEEARANRIAGVSALGAAKLAPIRSDAAGVLRELGLCMVDTGDIPGAAENLKLALKLDPKCPEALVGLGRVRCAQMRFVEAVILFKRAVRLSADDEIRRQAETLLDHYVNYPRRTFMQHINDLKERLRRLSLKERLRRLRKSVRRMSKPVRRLSRL